MAMKIKPVMAVEKGGFVVWTKLFGEQKNMILSMLNVIREDMSGRPITLGIFQTAVEVSLIESLRAVFQVEFQCQGILDAWFSPAIGLNRDPGCTSVAHCNHPLWA
jgi:fatty acid-binding protein DegV